LDADLDAYRLGKKSRIEARGSLQDHVDRAREGQQFPAGAGKMGQEQEPPTLKERRARLEEGYAQLRQDAEDVLYEPMMHRRMEKLKRIMSEKLENEEEELLEHARKHGIGSGRIVDLKGKRAPKAFTVHEDDATGIILRARAFLKEGKWDQAMELYFDLARTNQNSDILSSFAMDAWTAKQVDIAGRSAVEAFNIDQNDLKANTVAARVLLAQHDPERPDAETRLGVALQHVDRALEQQPKWPELIGLKGSVYLARRKYKTACEHFKSALEACDKMHLSRQLRLPLLRDYAKALAGRGKYKLAHSHLKIAHQLEPENIEVISLLAELHEHGFKDLEGAAPFYRMAVQLQPDDVASLVRLGQLFSDPNYSGQNFAAARQCYERAMVLQPQPDFWFPLGWLSMQLGEHDKGMQCLQKAAEADPDANNCWTSVVLLAENYAFDTNPDTQQASLNRAIQLYMFALEEKNDFNVKMNLVKCFMRADRIDDAEALLQVLKMEDPGNVEMKCVLADVYYLADKTQEALREVDSIISTHPAELLPHFMKGKYLYQLGDHKAALPHLEMAASGVIAPSMSSPEFNNLKNILEPEVKAAAERAIAEGKISPPVNRGSTRSGVTAAGEQDAEAETETDRNPNGTTGPRPGSLLSEDEDSGFSSGNGQHPTFVPEALRLLARCFVESERWADAKRVLARAADHDPENPTILLALGESLYHNGDIEDAIFSFRKASVLDRNALRPLFQLGNLYAESSQYDQAITYYLRLIENLERRETDPSARESEEEMTVEDLGQLIYGVYSNLSSCYAELATKDRSNQAKHLRSAKQWAVKAEAMKQEM
jgi:tetratricopeptide (TPR) repeat protein